MNGRRPPSSHGHWSSLRLIVAKKLRKIDLEDCNWMQQKFIELLNVCIFHLLELSMETKCANPLSNYLVFTKSFELGLIIFKFMMSERIFFPFFSFKEENIFL